MPLLNAGSATPVSIASELPGSVKITHVTLGAAGTESSHALSANTQKIYIAAKKSTKADLRYSYVSGGTDPSGGGGTKEYVEIPAVTSESDDGFKLTSGTLYLQAPSTGSVVVIVKEWF